MKALEDMIADYEVSDPGAVAPPKPPRRSESGSFRASCRDRLWPITTLFGVLAALATITSAFGELIRDNRFEQFSNPARRIAKTLTLWDGSRGLGRVREDFWPGTTAPLAVFRGLGLSPVLSQKLWHALVLVILGVGTVAVLRLFRRDIGVEHVLAGLAVMFGAYSASFLVPSNLMFQVALTPWFVVALWRGVTETRPWRWAAIFALLVFLAGNADLPGLIYSMVPLIPVTLYLLLIERSVRIRDLVAWLARAGLLCVLISFAAMAKTIAAAANFDQRLAETESPQVSSITSSWSESFRGLGNWLSYFRHSGAMQKPQGQPYFVNPVVIMATFVPAIVALAVVWRSQWRPRLLFIWMAICSLVIMVEAYPLTAPSPIGSVLLDLMTNADQLRAFRNTYKAGAGLAIGIAILLGVGVVALARRAGIKWSGGRRIVLIGAALALLAGAVPFWTGGLYDGDRAMTAVPGYWTQAMSWLDAQPADTRILVLPASSRTHYRWGWVGDDIFDAMLTRDHAIATGIPLSTPLAANLLEAVSLNASDPTYQVGTLAPIMRRLGISELVLRNDLDWQEMGRPRPALWEGLRHDPALHEVATFGDPGEYTTRERDDSLDAVAERKLPPVQIYRIDDVGPEVRAASAGPSTLVSGDGQAWPGLAAGGQLNGSAPVQYTGSLDSAAIAAVLSGGSPLVITDTNRRRLRVVIDHEADYSYLLSDGQDLDRSTQTLFPDPATQSRAWFPDATSISLSGNPRTINGSEAWNRPANAFDGDPNTEFFIHQAQAPDQRVFRVQLRKRHTVDRLVVTLAAGMDPDKTVSQLKLKFSEGPDLAVKLTGPTTTFDFPARETNFIDIQILGVNPDAQTVGFADFTFPGLDLREFVQAPTDVRDAAAGDANLRAQLDRSPVSFLFARDTNVAPIGTTVSLSQADHSQPAELAVRRRFSTIGSRPYGLQGVFHVGARTSDTDVASILGPLSTGTASARADGDLAGWGGYAADGDPSTTWAAPSEAGQSVTVQVPARPLSSVKIHTLADATTARITTVQVTVGDQVQTVPLDLATCTAPNATCTPTATVTLPERSINSQVTVTVVAVDPTAIKSHKQVQISEIEVNGIGNNKLETTAALSTECRSVGLTIDDADVPVRLSGTVADLLASRPIGWKACAPVTLPEGDHQLVSADAFLMDRIQLTTSDITPPPPTPEVTSSVTVVSRTATSMHLRVSSPGPAMLWMGESFDNRWVASVDGGASQEATAFDTQSGWEVGGAGTRDVILRFRPARLFESGLLITGATVVGCLWLALRPARRRRRADGEEVASSDE